MRCVVGGRSLLYPLVLVFCCLGPFLAAAQTTPAADPAEATPAQQLQDLGPLSEAAVRDLVARLNDAEVREILLQQLDAKAREAEPAVSGLETVLTGWQQKAEALREGFGAIFRAFPEIPAGVATALARLPEQGSARVLMWLAAGLLAMLAGGWIAERLVRRSLRRVWSQTVDSNPRAGMARVGCLLMRLVLEFVFLAVFVAGALAVFFALWQGSEITRTVVMTYVTALVAVRVFAIFSHVLLAPRHAGLRLAQMSDHDAQQIHRKNIVLASIAAFGFLTCSLLEHLGIGDAVHRAMTFTVGFVLIATLAYSIVRSRKAVAGDLAWDRENSSRFRLLFADTWPGIAAAYVVVLYGLIIVIAFTGGQVSYLSVFGSLITVIFLPHIDAVIERAARHLEAREDMSGQGAGQMRIVMLRAGRIVLFLVAGLFLVRIWGVDLFSLAQASVGSRIAGALVDIGLTALVAYLLWEMARITIDRRLAAEVGDEETAAPEPGEQGGQGMSRLQTLLPLLRVTVQVTIAVMAGMLILSALGVNIGPLLAGAGVVGLAVGFGAQTLVRDIVSGVFFLVDDAFRVGEYIDVGSVKGTVEKISLRSLRLRHHRGALHTIPFGEIQHLTNYSRDWAIMKLEFRVPFDTDLEKVRKIFKKIGQELLQDEELGPDFLQPFKSQGVLATDDSAFLLRGKFMAKPGRQFMIRRAVFQAVQRAFAEAGIKFADRRVTVNVPGAEEMEPAERAAAEKAAASAVASAEAAAAEAAPPAPAKA